jgi:cytochrome d ubiquinol oxidase subunit I
VAQAKFVHTVSAGYVVGAMFVLSISAWFLLRGRHVALAQRSLTVAASFGLASALSVVVLGDESGYTMTEHQKMKIASIEAMWHTEPAPASFTVFGWPDVESRETRAELRLPWLLGLIATRSLDQEVPGIHELVAQARTEIEDGLIAYDALQSLRLRRDDAEARTRFDAHKQKLGYALLLRRYVDDPRTATAAQIDQAAWSTVPNVPVLFWSFRLMVLLGIYFIALFAYSFWLASSRPLEQQRRYLKLAFLSLPLPWIAAELGWIVAEYGRQPWAIEGVLPTFLGVSAVSPGQVLTSLIGFVLFYSLLAIADVALMVKFVRRGPIEAEGH